MRVAIAISVFALALQGSYKLEEREAFHHTFSKDGTIDVDNVNGWITVTGDGGNTIRVDGEKVVRADDAERMALGKKNVALDVDEKDGVARLAVNHHENHDHGYEVTYNFTIHVPRATALRLHSVNGKISADDTAGKFDLHTINGAVTMTNVAGSGSAETLNGNTTITFRENPKADSLFKSFNGHVDVGFLPGLAANVHVKTFNGADYTDFDATALAGVAGHRTG